MPRRPREQTPGFVYHVTSRGTRKSDIVMVDADRIAFLSALDRATEAAGWELLSYTLMTNHYHLLLRLLSPTLARGMHALNTIVATRFNMREEVSGHLFGARYHSQPVFSRDHLMESFRYIALNPVRAGMVRDPINWPWASYPAIAGAAAPPRMLARRAVLAEFGHDEARYREWVAAGADKPPRPTLADILGSSRSPQAVATAHGSWGYRQREIAEFLGVGKSTINRWLRGT
jgi:REP element-mobilizing transposase RayT